MYFANMLIKWAPKEYNFCTRFKQKEEKQEFKPRCTTLTTNRLDKLNYTHLPQSTIIDNDETCIVPIM